jgi:cation transport protein ChaC
MWIFAYGSLMFDGWEAAYDCTGRLWAELAGYRRAFNKKSVENWGTPEAPGLTLNLTQDAGAACHGVAFSFNDGKAERVLRPLRKREACAPTELPVRLEDGRMVTAFVYIYTGKNLLGGSVPLAEKAALILKAKGTSGASRDYVRRTFEDLKAIGIDDPAVTELWKAVQQAG